MEPLSCAVSSEGMARVVRVIGVLEREAFHVISRVPGSAKDVLIVEPNE